MVVAEVDPSIKSFWKPYTISTLDDISIENQDNHLFTRLPVITPLISNNDINDKDIDNKNILAAMTKHYLFMTS